MEAREEFIKVLAEYLAGTNQVAMSIGLQYGKPEAKLWAKMRELSPLFGYPTAEEAVTPLSDFLNAEMTKMSAGIAEICDNIEAYRGKDGGMTGDSVQELWDDLRKLIGIEPESEGKDGKNTD